VECGTGFSGRGRFDSIWGDIQIPFEPLAGDAKNEKIENRAIFEKTP
jgi:hypothetical protein